VQVVLRKKVNPVLAFAYQDQRKRREPRSRRTLVAAVQRLLVEVLRDRRCGVGADASALTPVPADAGPGWNLAQLGFMVSVPEATEDPPSKLLRSYPCAGWLLHEPPRDQPGVVLGSVNGPRNDSAIELAFVQRDRLDESALCGSNLKRRRRFDARPAGFEPLRVDAKAARVRTLGVLQRYGQTDGKGKYVSENTIWVTA